MNHESRADSDPIFVAGCGRSGTSLVRTLLDAHPDIFIPTESLFIVDYARYADRVPKPIWRWLLLHEPQLRGWYEGDGVGGATAVDEIRGIHCECAARYGARAWGQKTPRFVRHRDLLERSFGPLRWVLVYRDPRAVCASMRKSGQHSDSVRRSVRRWKRDNQEIVQKVDGGERPEAGVSIVKYETFVANFRSEIPHLLRDLGVRAVQVEELFANARPGMPHRSRFQDNAIRGDVIPKVDHISAWREVLSLSEIAYIERECEYEMRAMGYRRLCEDEPMGWARWVAFWWGDMVHSLTDMRIVWRYFRFWPAYPLYVVARKVVFSLPVLWSGR